MPTENPCSRTTRRTARSVPFMDGLESRMLLSSAPTSAEAATNALESKISLPVSTKVVHISSSSQLNNGANWPGRGQSITLSLAPGSYSLSSRFVYGNVSIVAADSAHPPTINLPQVFKKVSAAKYLGGNATLYVLGSLNVRNVKTTGGENAVFVGTSSSGKVDVENVNMTDGGAIFRGSGGSTVLLKNIQSGGIPRTNFIANFDHNIGTVIFDNRGTSSALQQGGHIVSGNPVGEATIRVMDVDSLTLIGVTTRPWFYKPGREWKQDVQLRPSSNIIKVIDCNFYQPDVGDMTWRSPARPINEVDFINSHLTKGPNVTNGVKTITFSNTLIGSSKVTKTI
jgi:hypothetical protein